MDEFEDVLCTTVSESGEMIFGFEDSVGYRSGGPKEARLKKVALLGGPKDGDETMVSIKIHIDPKKRVNALLVDLRKRLATLEKFVDVYVPENFDTSKPALGE